MNGRNAFIKYSFFINSLVFIIKFFPSKFNKFIWNSIQNLHGKIGIGLRYCLLKASINTCGVNVSIGPYVEINNWKDLSVGDNVSIHSHCYIEALGGVEIGNDVSIAQACSIFSVNHTWKDPNVPIKYNEINLAKVIIMDDVWVGSSCKILSGVTIGKRSVIGAGAVVTKNVDGNSLYGGVPAKKIKSI
ncbi:acyltransferase [Paenibacillus sp. LMG 31459]|uniref:Acyltransferase n=1 Tax=Paenibacillus phytohabitans TaxID=2654978 RepID=A0ABX1YNL2_9BACL|nr:acyltransferase [Paenibacillus phytohabitans]NOU82458.1 acyltransferase [Paenibacillus phytohabitans]